MIPSGSRERHRGRRRVAALRDSSVPNLVKLVILVGCGSSGGLDSVGQASLDTRTPT